MTYENEIEASREARHKHISALERQSRAKYPHTRWLARISVRNTERRIQELENPALIKSISPADPVKTANGAKVILLNIPDAFGNGGMFPIVVDNTAPIDTPPDLPPAA